MTEEEYIELYERYSRLPPERRRSILLEEAPRTEYTDQPEGGKTAKSGEQRRPTREELIAELMKRPPKRRLEIIRVVEIVVAKKRLDKAIKDGTARPN